jgi:hypothetical protein
VACLPMMALVVAVSLAVTGGLLGTGARVPVQNIPCFLLGAGFMLLETKAITELGLTFGNTWQVIGVAISGILLLAYIANRLVARFRFSRISVPCALLILALAAGYELTPRGSAAALHLGRWGTLILVSCPVLFSDIIFSALLDLGRKVSGIMSANLLGGMCGDLLEYNSMYFGLSSLYVVAVVIYGLACSTAWATMNQGGSAARG